MQQEFEKQQMFQYQQMLASMVASGSEMLL